jgi:hypothetical protein
MRQLSSHFVLNFQKVYDPKYFLENGSDGSTAIRFCKSAPGDSVMRANLDKTDARSSHVGPGSERSFGLVFAAFFAVIAAHRVWTGREWEWWAAAAVLMVVLALAAPTVLAPFNRIWYRFGLLLSRIFQPIVLGLLFFVTVTPIALIMRSTGKDPLRLRFRKDLDSYWIVRDPPGPSGSSLNRQF